MGCLVEDCDRDSTTRGMCQKHYVRWWRHGDPRKTLHDPSRGPIENRLWSRVTKSDGCWTWAGTVNRQGYGVIGLGARGTGKKLVHRLAWELLRGPIPPGLHVLHRCDNPPCVNPDHLFPGTVGDNNRDMVEKKRHYKQKVTHCPKGHEYTPENTKPNVGGKGRRCRTCHNEDSRRRRSQLGAA